MSEIQQQTMDLMYRLSADPVGTRNQLLAYIKTASADDVKNTLHQLVDIDDYVKRYHDDVLIEVRRLARLTEIEMAKRWPAKQGKVRNDDRPVLSHGNTSVSRDRSADNEAWKKIYKVGKADPETIIAEQDATRLSRRAVMETVTADQQMQELRETAMKAREQMEIAKERGPVVLGFEWGVEFQFLVTEQAIHGRKFSDLMKRADGEQRKRLLAEIQAIFEKYFYPYFVEDVTNV
jgi:hypothetical protein